MDPSATPFFSGAVALARRESDKEDLIRDATALVERVEFVCDGHSQLITLGLFRDKRLAVYFDQDPFYQFDADDCLRRAFENGRLYRSQGTTLAMLERQRSDMSQRDAKVLLRRTDLTQKELSKFRSRMTHHLTWLTEATRRNTIHILRSVPSGSGLPHGTLSRLCHILSHGEEFPALSPAPR